jgi:hypothetical protein
MESLQNNENNDELVNLIGEITDYKSEITDDNENMVELFVNRGDFIEKYFNEKLKYLLKSNNAFCIAFEISQVRDELILSINFEIINNNKLKEKPVKEIFKIIDRYLKDETAIEIDSLIPIAKGEELNKFFTSIEENSFPSGKLLDEGKNYTVIVESTYSLKSQIVKKTNQLRKSFLVFSLIHKLYLAYPKYIEKYYKYFIRKYIFKEKIAYRRFENEDPELDLSSFGNYVFIIASNKTYKNFKEVEFLTKKFYYEDGIPDDSFSKCFEKKAINLKQKEINKEESSDNNSSSKQKIVGRTIKTNKIFKNDINYKEISQNVRQNPLLLQAYKNLNYLITKINQENNCSAKIIYLDAYLNITSPKCLISQKLGELNEKMEEIIEENKKQKEINQVLTKIISEKFPEYDLSIFHS